jgi:hypothetical protein
MSKPRSTIWDARNNSEGFYLDRVDREKDAIKRRIQRAERRLNDLLRTNGERENKFIFFPEPKNYAQLQSKLDKLNAFIEIEKVKRRELLSREFQREHRRAMAG